jgi:hypothetical protein
MIRLPKSVVSFGAVALVAGVLALAVPRAAHAVAAAMVLVTNTAANPAITQSVPSQAAQLVRLFAIISPLDAAGASFGALTAGQQSSSQYSVPNNQFLVITAIDVTPAGGCTSGAFGFKLFGLGTLPVWTASAPFTGHFEYPSGIVLPPGGRPCQLSSLPRATRQAIAVS